MKKKKVNLLKKIEPILEKKDGWKDLIPSQMPIDILLAFDIVFKKHENEPFNYSDPETYVPLLALVKIIDEMVAEAIDFEFLIKNGRVDKILNFYKMSIKNEIIMRRKFINTEFNADDFKCKLINIVMFS